MKINTVKSSTFGWNIKTHLAITELALQDNQNISKVVQRYIARASELPDLIKSELVDMNSRHFYDALNIDPSFGTKNDSMNNAMSAFLYHDSIAKEAAKEKNYDKFYREIGYALHYLQDGGTPPHTEHGNYFKKFIKIPMHIAFERGKKNGATKKLNQLMQNYKFQDVSCSSLEALFHNTALYTLQPENHVKWRNFSNWTDIQQRCFNRCVNSSKAYLNRSLNYNT